jgi:hypothetical protein
VGEVVADPVLACQSLELFDEPPPVGVQLRLGLRRRDSAAAEHQRVEVARESQQVEPPPAVGPHREPLEVLVVEIAVSHAHRLAAVAHHRLERGGVSVGSEQRNLAADQLRVLTGAPRPPQVPHLRVDHLERVGSVDPHAVRLA